MEKEEKGFIKKKLTKNDLHRLKWKIVPRAILFCLLFGVFFSSVPITLHGLSQFAYNLAVIVTFVIYLVIVYYIYKQARSVYKSGNKLVKTGIVRLKEHTISMHLSKRTSIESERKAYRLDHYDVFIDDHKFSINKISFHDIRVGDTVELSFTENDASFFSHTIITRAMEDISDTVSNEKVKVLDLEDEDKQKLKRAYIYNPLALVGCLPLPILLLVLLFGISSGISELLVFGILTVGLCIFLIYRYRISISLKQKADEKHGKKELLPAIVYDYYQTFKKQSQRNVIRTTKGYVYVDPGKYKTAKVGETVLLMRSDKHKMPFDIYISEGEK